MQWVVGTQPNPAKTHPVGQGWVAILATPPTRWVFCVNFAKNRLKIAVLSDFCNQVELGYSRLLISLVWFRFWVLSDHYLANPSLVQVLTFQTKPCFRVRLGFCKETNLAIYRHYVIISACKFI